MKRIKTPVPPTGLSRFLFRLPIHLYRWKLGWLLGSRFLHLTHTGRVSGKRREVVIEVVGRDGRAYHCCAGFGARSDWYRNVCRTPEVTIQVGRHRLAAIAEPLAAEDGAGIMAAYGARHPKLAVRLARAMGFVVDGSAADFAEVGRTVPFVRFTPTDKGMSST